jgi:hypothetical protein
MADLFLNDSASGSGSTPVAAALRREVDVFAWELFLRLAAETQPSIVSDDVLPLDSVGLKG